jgi:hypothetical protein
MRRALSRLGYGFRSSTHPTVLNGSNCNRGVEVLCGSLHKRADKLWMCLRVTIVEAVVDKLDGLAEILVRGHGCLTHQRRVVCRYPIAHVSVLDVVCLVYRV